MSKENKSVSPSFVPVTVRQETQGYYKGAVGEISRPITQKKNEEKSVSQRAKEASWIFTQGVVDFLKLVENGSDPFGACAAAGLIGELINHVILAKANSTQLRRLTQRICAVVSCNSRIRETCIHQNVSASLELFRKVLEDCILQAKKYSNKNYAMRVLRAGTDQEKFIDLNKRLNQAISQLDLTINVETAVMLKKSLQYSLEDKKDIIKNISSVFESQKQSSENIVTLKNQQHEFMLSQQEQTAVMQEQVKSMISMMEEQDRQLRFKYNIDTDKKPKKLPISTRLLVPFHEINIQRKIAQGSFGSIYQGTWCGTSVVVKKVCGECDLFLMLNKGAPFKLSDKGHLYLYKSNREYFYYIDNGKKQYITEKELPANAFQKAIFNQPAKDPAKCTDEAICNAVLEITSKKGHTLGGPASKKEDYDQFIREVKIMASLGNPHITQLYGACLEPDACLVMEYMEQGSLDKLLTSEKKLTDENKIKLALDIAAGLGYLHRRDVLHRDVKTANILINAEGRAKLTDFGLSKTLDSKVKGIEKLANDIQWLAPEVILSKNAVYYPESDIYSYGMILWSLCTGKKPFDGLPIKEVERKIINGEHEIIPDNIPLKLKYIIKKCWSSAIEERPDLSEIIKTLKNMQIESQLSPVDLHREGKICEREEDFSSAAHHYRLAAEHGFFRAKANLGTLYLSGKGVSKDKQEAYRWLSEAAEQGHGRSQYNVAVMLERGEGVEKNISKALYWYQKAAKQNVGDASRKAQELEVVLSQRRCLQRK